jgi:uncharacterized protein (TIGR03790 family)
MSRTRNHLRLRLLVALGLALASVTPLLAQSPRHVLLVINDASQDSIRVGEHYARVRGIDQAQVVRISVEPKDDVARLDYERRIEEPIARWLRQHAAEDRIHFIVLTKGVPLRVTGTGGRQGTLASVDSELSLLYRSMTGRPVPPGGPLPNPYFLGDTPVAQAKPFTHETHDIYLVTRLDGFTADDVIALIDRAQKPASEGRIVLDMKAAWTDKGNEWLQAASERLTAMGKGALVTLESTSEVVGGTQGVIGYYSWGSNDPAIRTRRLGLGFVPGAIAGTFVSSDGRTFAPPPEGWTLGTWSDPRTYFAGSPQSLAGDLIREGVTGVSGHVAEPFLDATIRPQILFPVYLSGFTLAEAYYLAMPYLSWQTIVVGDPLCQVASMKRPDETTLDPPQDPATEEPRYFATRRFEAAMAERQGQGAPFNADAVKLALRADARLVRDDKTGAEEALIEATKLEPRLLQAQLTLAQAFEQRGEHAKAMERYRAVLAQDPNNVVALNNLAYAVATREDKPGDALPLAQRAFTLSRGNATIADTLGWVHHLMGNNTEAARYLTQAARTELNNAEIQLHAAQVLLAGGQIDAARQALERALQADPAIADRDVVKALQAKVGKGGPAPRP